MRWARATEFAIVVAALLTGACATAAPLDTTTAPAAPPAEATIASTVAPSTTPSKAPLAVEPLGVVDLPDAVALSVAASGTAPPLVAWTAGGSVWVASVDLAGTGLAEPVVVSGEVAPAVHPIERPAVVSDDGEATVAFTSWSGAVGSVHSVKVVNGVAGPVTTVSGSPRPETVLVHLTLDETNQPIAAWLEDSTLSVARSVDGVLVEEEGVDELTCDCCHPVPIAVGDHVVVAYRNLLEGPEGTERDVAVVIDEGDGFGEPEVIADSPWLLEACPLSGPTIVAHGDTLVVAWMDARQSVHPDQRGSTIWVDRGTLQGSFGADVAITDSGVHGQPVMASDADGGLHLVWETRSPDPALSYAFSGDGGLTFGERVVLVGDGDGRPLSPSVAVDGDLLLVSWTSRAGGHVAWWPIEVLTR